MAEQLVEEVVEQTARIAGRSYGGMVGCLFVGVGLGFVAGYYYSKKKLRSDIMAEAEEEIAEAKKYYSQKVKALDNHDKPSVESIIKDRGYSEAYQHSGNEGSEQRLRPPVPIDPRPPIHMDEDEVRPYRTDAAQKDKNDDWDYQREIVSRSETTPHIIHQDEFERNESGYSQSTLVYYPGDDVLVDDDDQHTQLHNKERLIGSYALSHFGHGSDDYNVVYVRNDELEIEYEICRVKGSWEVEVAGLSDHEPD